MSDLIFTLSNAPGTLGATSASGQLANIGAGGTATNVAATPTRWLGAGGQGSFSISGNTITLEAIGGGQPSQLLLPSGTSFTNANASITGGQFSPFVIGRETFTFNLSGVTAATTITSASFSFGTGPDTTIPGVPSQFSVPGLVVGAGLPGLVAAAFSGLLLWRRVGDYSKRPDRGFTIPRAPAPQGHLTSSEVRAAFGRRSAFFWKTSLRA